MVEIKSIKIVSKLDLVKTPVVRLFINEARLKGIEVGINQKNTRHDIVIFVGNGIMPKLLLHSYLGRGKMVYWSLESYTGFENNSKIMWLTRLQYLLNWRRVVLMLPLRSNITNTQPVIANPFDKPLTVMV